MRANNRFRPVVIRLQGAPMWRRLPGVLGLGLALAGCGGGSSSSPTTSSGSTTTGTGAVGTISLFAGAVGIIGNQDGSTLSGSRLNLPHAVVADANGNVFIADSGNNTLRMLDVNGNVTTIAGRPGVAGSADGAGQNALFAQPQGIALSPVSTSNQDVIFVSDSGNNTLRKVTVNLSGTNNSVASATVGTIAGQAGVAGAADGAAAAALFNQPTGLVVDSSGVIYVADTGNSIIRKVDTSGTVTTYAGYMLETSVLTPASSGVTQTSLAAVTHLSPGTTTSASGSMVRSYTPLPGLRDGVLTPASITMHRATDAATYPQFNRPQGLALRNGVLYVADTGNNAIRTVDAAGNVMTFAGACATVLATTAPAGQPATPVACPAGSLDGIAGASDSGTFSYDTTNIPATNKQPGTITVPPRFNGPTALVFDAAGNLLVADGGNNLIRKVDSGGNAGTVTTYAGKLRPELVQYNYTQSTLYYTSPVGDKTNPTLTSSQPSILHGTSYKPITLGPFSGNQASSGFSNISFVDHSIVAGLLVPPSDGYEPATTNQFYITDNQQQETYSPVSRVVTPGALTSSTQYTYSNPVLGPLDTNPAVAGNMQVYQSISISIDSVYVSPPAPLPGSSDGAAQPGTSALQAQFNTPSGLTLVGSTLYVADMGNHTVRRVQADSAGKPQQVATVAGAAGQSGFADGLAAVARLYNPTGMVVYHDPNNARVTYLFESDAGNHVIRVVTTTTDDKGNVVSSVVNTIAGVSGVPGWQDSSNGLTAEFNTPLGLALDASNPQALVLYVADGNNDLIRRLTPGNLSNLTQPWSVTTLAGDTSTLGSASAKPVASPGLVDSNVTGVAKFYLPYGLAFYNGSLYVADSLNHAIREVDPEHCQPASGSAHPLPCAANETDVPTKVTTIAGYYNSNTYAGTPGAYVGGTADSARFFQPQGIAINKNGVIYITETGNSTIDRIVLDNTAGVTKRYAFNVAGHASGAGFLDGTGTQALFNGPNGIAVQTTAAGDYLYVADTANAVVRKIDLTTASFPVTTVIGTTGVTGFSPGATPGYINTPNTLALDGNNLYVTMSDAIVRVTAVP